jgi:GWxTD domain-containing protein
MYRRAVVSMGVLAIALLAAPAPASAQDAAERAALEKFRDSLASTADSSGLLAVERQLIEQAKTDRSNALLHLRLGFLSLRLGDLGGNSHFDDAASEFQWAIDLQPEWPYSWFGMGLAEYGVGDSQLSIVAGLKTMLGKDALTRSAAAFARSAEVDPSFVQGLVELANTALRQRVNIKLDVALQALRRAAGTPAGANPQVLLARGRVEREVGDVDSALVALNRYLAAGESRGMGLLEIARTRFLLGSFDGAAPYFEGAAADDSATVAAYRADLVPISSDSMLREFDATRGLLRAAYLRAFWTQRDRAELRADGERLREHYRRLFYARKNFLLSSNNRHYDIVERYRSGSRDFDDRGIIYIRHGQPSDRASFQAPGVEPNESWRYDRTDGELVFHFIAREDVQDYKLVESVFDVLGFSGAVRLPEEGAGVGSNTVAEQLLLSRQNLSPIYQRLQGAGRAGLSRYQNQERRLGEASIAIGTKTDSYGLRFSRPLRAKTDVLAVGREGDNELVQITYAIAGAGLEPVTVSQGLLYTVRLRFSAMDRTGKVVATLDTTRHFVAPQPVPDSEHLVGRLAVPVPRGVLKYRLALQQGEETGVVLPLDSVRVGQPESSPLALSDLVLGSRTANLTWQLAEQDTVFFNPLRVFRTGEELELYYELEGLQPAAPYATQVVVRKRGGGGGLFGKLFGGSGAAISVKFDEQATGPVVRARRVLKLDRLKPGEYEMEVTVTDREGRKDRRTRPFDVSGE